MKKNQAINKTQTLYKTRKLINKKQPTNKKQDDKEQTKTMRNEQEAAELTDINHLLKECTND